MRTSFGMSVEKLVRMYAPITEKVTENLIDLVSVVNRTLFKKYPKYYFFLTTFFHAVISSY